MDLNTIVKLVDAGFTADEIRSWAVAKQAPQTRSRPSRSARARQLIAATSQPTSQPKESHVLQELPPGLPLNTHVRRLVPGAVARRRPSAFTAADESEIPFEVSRFIHTIIESSPGSAVVMYDELKERVKEACPEYNASVYRVVKGLFPTVAHKRQDGRGSYVLTDVAWRKK